MRNLRGTWRGLYSYPKALDPVSFMTQLHHAEEWLTGTTNEAVTIGVLAGLTLTAMVMGRVSG